MDGCYVSSPHRPFFTAGFLLSQTRIPPRAIVGSLLTSQEICFFLVLFYLPQKMLIDPELRDNNCCFLSIERSGSFVTKPRQVLWPR